MYIISIINYCLTLFNIIYSFNINNIANKNLDIIHNDLKKTSIFSKLIYDYDYCNKYNHKKNIKIENCIITLDLIKKNNIYFNENQFFTHLDKKYFTKKTEIYFNNLQNDYPNTEIYGYFYNKNRLHSLILLNHKHKEIITVFRGSQYTDEWINNLIFQEKEITFNKKYKIHRDILYMFTYNKIDNNMVYILNKIFNLYPKYRKIFTGHSKANIESILLILKMIDIIDIKTKYEIFSYGNPQIFNYELGDFLHRQNNIKIYNIVNDLDIITLLPIRYHIGDEILLHDNSIKIIKHEHPYTLKNNIMMKNLLLSIQNHDMNRYITNIFNSKMKKNYG